MYTIEPCDLLCPEDLPVAEDNCSTFVLVTLVAVDTAFRESARKMVDGHPPVCGFDACGNEATAQQPSSQW